MSEQNNTIKFRFGIPGFEFLTKFKIADIEGYAPFRVLKSTEEPDMSMLILDVNLIQMSTDIKIPKKDLKKIRINGSDTGMAVYAILKYDKDSQSFTANLKAPIVINSAEHLGQQVILDDNGLTVNYPLNLV
ncbi:MAG: flagellar assembly protein FliW [Candidatus Hatepunaea meridiana]|nr:flagellar assembly protein FliW [Candidatus Hatepunaea meridiana]